MPTNNQKRNIALLFVASLALSGGQVSAPDVVNIAKNTAITALVIAGASTAQILSDEYSAAGKTRDIQQPTRWQKLKTAVKATGTKASWRAKGRVLRNTLKPLATKDQTDKAPSTFTNIGTVLTTNKVGEAVIIASILFLYREALKAAGVKGFKTISELSIFNRESTPQPQSGKGEDSNSDDDAAAATPQLTAPHPAPSSTAATTAATAAPLPASASLGGTVLTGGDAAASRTPTPPRSRSQPPSRMKPVTDNSRASTPEASASPKSQHTSPTLGASAAPATSAAGHNEQAGSFVSLASTMPGAVDAFGTGAPQPEPQPSPTPRFIVPGAHSDDAEVAGQFEPMARSYLTAVTGNAPTDPQSTPDVQPATKAPSTDTTTNAAASKQPGSVPVDEATDGEESN